MQEQTTYTKQRSAQVCGICIQTYQWEKGKYLILQMQKNNNNVFRNLKKNGRKKYDDIVISSVDKTLQLRQLIHKETKAYVVKLPEAIHNVKLYLYSI